MPHIMIGAKKGWLARLNHAPLNSNYRKEWGRISATYNVKLPNIVLAMMTVWKTQPQILFIQKATDLLM